MRLPHMDALLHYLISCWPANCSSPKVLPTPWRLIIYNYSSLKRGRHAFEECEKCSHKGRKAQQTAVAKGLQLALKRLARQTHIVIVWYEVMASGRKKDAGYGKRLHCCEAHKLCTFFGTQRYCDDHCAHMCCVSRHRIVSKTLH